MKKIWYGWEEIVRDVGVLCRDITISEFTPDVIVGLSRGGLTPGIMLSHWLKKPFKPIVTALRDFPDWEEYLPRKTDKCVLIVDDICDSGVTFKKIQHTLIKNSVHKNCDVRFATLWLNNEQDIEPDYYVHEIAKDSENAWIDFAWESWWDPARQPGLK